MEEAVRGTRLGAFELEGLLGTGGMGEVWRAVHLGQRVPAAIKVIRRAAAREPRMVDAFRREVQAVARLGHPNVILVLDHGLVDPSAEERSGGHLVAGSPYLAMELCAMGSVRSLPPGGTWARARAVLLGVLEALAHAHARGVVHRDVKAENILVGAPDDLRPGLKLSDFGLATAWRGAAAGGGWGGTPASMAPEQCQGRARDIGPWTDLYAVGCLAWELVCGRTAFRRETVDETLRAHVEAQAPPLAAHMAVPEGLDRWVAWLLEREVGDRCARAADAAWALRELGLAEGPPLVAWTAATDDSELSTLARTTHRDAGEAVPGGGGGALPAYSATVDEWADASETRPSRPALASSGSGAPDSDASVSVAATPGTHPGRRPAPWGPAPMPRSWRAPEALVPPRLIGVGLGLWGMREVPVAGREVEREALWAALSEVRMTGGPRVVVLRGASGFGKSRLASWLCERAHELGAASVLRAVFDEEGQGEPLARMVAEAFGCVGLDDRTALPRVMDALRAAGAPDPYAARAITEAMRGALAAPGRGEQGRGEARATGAGGAGGAGGALGAAGHGEEDSEPLVRFGSPDARLAAAALAAEVSARGRAVVLWLDDVQWGPDGIALVRQVLKRGAAAPILAVLTAREDALAEQPAVARLLDDLEGRAETSTIHLGPLEAGGCAELVSQLLGLEGILARDVVERVQGNPLFAVQLVGDWVARRVLVPTAHGFALRTGEQAVLPDDVHALWRGRVERLLSDAPAAAAALEVLALLGQEVELPAWRAACRVAGVEGGDALLETLASRRLGERTGERFSLAHGMLRESAVRRAREDGRLTAIAAACASALVDGGDQDRVGRLLAMAGDHERAAAALLAAARRADHRGEYRRVLALLDVREESLTARGVPLGDARWAVGWGLSASAAVSAGDFARAEADAQRVLGPPSGGDTAPAGPGAMGAAAAGAAAAGAAAVGAEAAGTSGGAGTALSATPAAPVAGEAVQRALFARGSLLHMRGAIVEALGTYRRATSAAEAIGDTRAVLRCLVRIGWAEMQRGDLTTARATYEGALAVALADGDPVDVGNARNGLSSVLCRAGDLDRALEERRAAARVFEEVGAPNGMAVALNGLGEIARQRGDLDGAEAAYRGAAAAYEAAGSDDRIVARLNLALLLVHRGRARELPPLLLPELAELERRQRRDLLVSVHSLLATAAVSQRAWRRLGRHAEAVERAMAAGAPANPDDAVLLGRAGEAAASAGRAVEARATFAVSARLWAALGRTAEAEAAQGRADALADATG